MMMTINPPPCPVTGRWSCGSSESKDKREEEEEIEEGIKSSAPGQASLQYGHKAGDGASCSCVARLPINLSKQKQRQKQKQKKEGERKTTVWPHSRGVKIGQQRRRRQGKRRERGREEK